MRDVENCLNLTKGPAKRQSAWLSMKLRLPQTSRDDFDMLYAALIIDENTVKQLRAIVGFRNIAVHDYQTVNIDILQQIVVNHLGDFSDYTKQILKF